MGGFIDLHNIRLEAAQSYYCTYTYYIALIAEQCEVKSSYALRVKNLYVFVFARHLGFKRKKNQLEWYLIVPHGSFDQHIYNYNAQANRQHPIQ